MTNSSKRLLEDKAFMDKINFLIANNRPIPVSHCNNCHGTIYKLNHWYECPNCGSTSTQYGGCYSSMTGESSHEWVDKCNQSKDYLNNK